MAIASPLHSAVIRGLKTVVGCDLDFILPYITHHQHNHVSSFLQRKHISDFEQVFILVEGLLHLYGVWDSSEIRYLLVL